eukprot:CAMPEP_0204109938 /NCGR_PEP_ID=MMETSP0361-20130328/1596_1 /ASSEMBLY_ACC=CAM_ASM_000343 /TAXON_ID=268821 /ORGANISM="Scrippsiella Hangoei, Strain SHTV-5" /LENGTH=145 /DNA_ID=CAMNT_0051059781 /DNA_START=204 /DNA_END=637 /DNA_ORIENTATION=-
MRVTTINGMAIVLPSRVSATTPHPYMVAGRWVSQSVDQRSRRAEPSMRTAETEDRRDSEPKQAMDVKLMTCKEQVAQNVSVWIVRAHRRKKVIDKASQAELDERSALNREVDEHGVCVLGAEGEGRQREDAGQERRGDDGPEHEQ